MACLRQSSFLFPPSFLSAGERGGKLSNIFPKANDLLPPPPPPPPPSLHKIGPAPLSLPSSPPPRPLLPAIFSRRRRRSHPSLSAAAAAALRDLPKRARTDGRREGIAREAPAAAGGRVMYHGVGGGAKAASEELRNGAKLAAIQVGQRRWRRTGMGISRSRPPPRLHEYLHDCLHTSSLLPAQIHIFSNFAVGRAMIFVIEPTWIVQMSYYQTIFLPGLLSRCLPSASPSFCFSRCSASCVKTPLPMSVIGHWRLQEEEGDGSICTVTKNHNCATQAAAKGPPGRMGVNATCCYSLHYFEMISQSPRRLIRPPAGGGGEV